MKVKGKRVGKRVEERKLRGIGRARIKISGGEAEGRKRRENAAKARERFSRHFLVSPPVKFFRLANGKT